MKYILLFIFTLFSLDSYSQNKFWDRIYYGGGGGFGISSNQTNISISPQVGYKITERYSAGVGIIYQYVRIKRPINTALSNFGWSIFNRFNITDEFFAYSEFERLKFEYFTSFSPERKQKSSYNSLFIGGGYSNQLGERTSFNAMALYNVLYDEADLARPYNSPWVIRVGVGVGIF